MLTPFENGWSTCDFFFYLSQLALTTLSHPLCITIISFLWGLVKSPHGIFSVIWIYLYHDMVFFYWYCFNKFEKRYTKTFMLGIAFLVKYEAVSFEKIEHFPCQKNICLIKLFWTYVLVLPHIDVWLAVRFLRRVNSSDYIEIRFGNLWKENSAYVDNRWLDCSA